MNQNVSERRSHVARPHESLSVTRQCELLSIHRSGLYYRSVGESDLNLELMRKIDEEFMLHPFLGVKRMTTWLNKDCGYKVNRKRIRRLYRLLGIQAIAPKPNTSKPSKQNRIYPYLLKGLKIERPNQVWATDITYIPVQGGYLYLVAIIDLYSRFVVGWSLSNTMTAEWCKETLRQAVADHGTPEILNTDQGSQFTSEVFTGFVTGSQIQMSMDGKGRAIDNIFIERLWRSVKYEQVYLYPSDDGLECYQGLKTYFDYYNYQRRHQSLDNSIPVQWYELKTQKAA